MAIQPVKDINELKLARQALGNLSQAKLAKVLGVTTRQIERLEAGTSEITPSMGLLIALLLRFQGDQDVVEYIHASLASE